MKPAAATAVLCAQCGRDQGELQGWTPGEELPQIWCRECGSCELELAPTASSSAPFTCAGGKWRIAPTICDHIESLRTSGQPYLEPFLGGGNVMWLVPDHGPRIGTDVDSRIINLWRALLSGDFAQPPVSLRQPISDDRYYELKKEMDLSDPETLYAGFCCSNRGRWFNGLKNVGSGDSWANIQKQIPAMQSVQLDCVDYRQHDPSGTVVFADPPYRGDKKNHKKYYPGLPPFDSDEFWDTMAKWAERARRNVVLVTERTGPLQESGVRVETLETLERKGSNPMTQFLYRVIP